jgi:YidC/Oxa1 family membrane protein insertase
VAPVAATVPGAESLTRILGYLPYLTVLFAAFVPLAATIYLALTTAWSFAERLILRRRMAG